MVRDWELIRKILTIVEQKETTHLSLTPDSIDGYESTIVSYHIYIMKEAGLIEAKCHKPSNASITCFAFSLTWNGHEFLDKIRDESVWTKVKSTIKDKGIELSFDVIKVAATKILESMIG